MVGSLSAPAMQKVLAGSRNRNHNRGEALGKVRLQDLGRNYRACYRFGAELTLNSDVITKHMLRKGVN